MGSISSIASAAANIAERVTALTVDVGFSTTVAGKTYDAGVKYSDGQFVAQDADIDGAKATGNSLQAAESNLISRIDVLV